MRLNLHSLSTVAVSLLVAAACAQRPNADAMAEEIFGAGIDIIGASYSGASQASGIFSGGNLNQ